MTYNELTYIIRGCIFRVYNKLGPGLLECVYEKALMRELQSSGLKACNQVEIDIDYDGVPLQLGLRMDILVEDKVIIELKSVEKMTPLFSKQLYTYLKLSNKHLGLLVNFNVDNILNGISRVVCNYSEGEN